MPIGCTSRSFAPSNLACFCVATTVPITRAICMNRLPEIPMVDDADNPGIDGRFHRIERKARFLAANEEHPLADARACRIDRDERAPHGLALGRQRLKDQEFEAREVLVLAR